MYKVISYYQEDHEAIANFSKTARYALSEYHNYLRNATLSILNGTADIAELTTKLTDNQVAISKLLIPYYSAETSTKLAELLKSQVTIMLDYITAAATNQSLTAIQDQWVSNTDEIATLLASIDMVRWPKATVVNFWTQNANYSHRQVVARLAADWVADIAACDLAYKNIIDFADVFSNGIVMSNLEKFSK